MTITKRRSNDLFTTFLGTFSELYNRKLLAVKTNSYPKMHFHDQTIPLKFQHKTLLMSQIKMQKYECTLMIILIRKS